MAAPIKAAPSVLAAEIRPFLEIGVANGRRGYVETRAGCSARITHAPNQSNLRAGDLPGLPKCAYGRSQHGTRARKRQRRINAVCQDQCKGGPAMPRDGANVQSLAVMPSSCTSIWVPPNGNRPARGSVGRWIISSATSRATQSSGSLGPGHSSSGSPHGHRGAIGGPASFNTGSPCRFQAVLFNAGGALTVAVLAELFVRVQRQRYALSQSGHKSKSCAATKAALAPEQSKRTSRHIVETVVPPGGLGKRLNEMTCTTLMLTNAQGVEHCRGTMVDFLAPLQPSQGEHNA